LHHGKIHLRPFDGGNRFRGDNDDISFLYMRTDGGGKVVAFREERGGDGEEEHGRK
jgi:hypothetical protein